MKLSVALLASAASLCIASPLPEPSTVNGTLVARATMDEVTCPMVPGRGNAAVTYSPANINEAYTIGTGLLRPPPDHATDNRGTEYPKYFSNFENIPLPDDCMTADTIDRQEYPILRGKVPFGDGSRAGPDRVIFARKGNGNFAYCYTLYHQEGDEYGAGPFAQCT